MFDITPQKPSHAEKIETLLDKAFGKARFSKTSYSYREDIGDIPELRFVAMQERQLLGTIRFWPVMICGKQSVPALLLGPLGVDPDHQGQGIGAALIHHGLEVAREQGHGIVLLVGDLTYYGRFGFGPTENRNIFMPGEQPERLLVRELRNDALIDVQGNVTSMANPEIRVA